jgi:hypothetical protein
MNYTETIKNYLSGHICELFDLGYEYSSKFRMMDKKTFTRIIGRLRVGMTRSLFIWKI